MQRCECGEQYWISNIFRCRSVRQRGLRPRGCLTVVLSWSKRPKPRKGKFITSQVHRPTLAIHYYKNIDANDSSRGYLATNLRQWETAVCFGHIDSSISCMEGSRDCTIKFNSQLLTESIVYAQYFLHKFRNWSLNFARCFVNLMKSVNDETVLFAEVKTQVLCLKNIT